MKIVFLLFVFSSAGCNSSEFQPTSELASQESEERKSSGDSASAPLSEKVRFVPTDPSEGAIEIEGEPTSIVPTAEPDRVEVEPAATSEVYLGHEAEPRASEPMMVGGAFLTCRSHGLNRDGDAAGISCRYRDVEGRKLVQPSLTHSFTVHDATQQALKFSLYPPQSPYGDWDWYLLVEQDKSVKTVLVSLLVSENEMEIDREETMVELSRGLDSVALAPDSRYENLVIGSGAALTDTSFARMSKFDRMSLAITLPTETTKISFTLQNLEAVGMLSGSVNYDVNSRLELWRGSQKLQSWSLPVGDSKELKFTTGQLPSGNYSLRILPGGPDFNLDDFMIGSLKVKGSSPLQFGEFKKIK